MAYANTEGVIQTLDKLSEFSNGSFNTKDRSYFESFNNQKRKSQQEVSADYYLDLEDYAQAASLDLDYSTLEPNYPNHEKEYRRPPIGGGRGRLLERYHNTFARKSPAWQQLDKDKEIKEGLKEIVGSGRSNEEIEEVFASTFKKPSVVEERCSPKSQEEVKREDKLSNISFSNSRHSPSSTSSSVRTSSPEGNASKLNSETEVLKVVLETERKNRTPKKEMKTQQYVPPHRRKQENTENVLGVRKDVNENFQSSKEKKSGAEKSMADDIKSGNEKPATETKKCRNVVLNQFMKQKPDEIKQSSSSDKQIVVPDFSAEKKSSDAVNAWLFGTIKKSSVSSSCSSAEVKRTELKPAGFDEETDDNFLWFGAAVEYPKPPDTSERNRSSKESSSYTSLKTQTVSSDIQAIDGRHNTVRKERLSYDDSKSTSDSLSKATEKKDS